MFILLLLCFSVVYSRNFDARFSVIKKGKDDSYFGFSVAQHQFSDFGPKKNVLFIGAPKESRIIDQRLSGGSIYQCPVGTTQEDDCTLITAADAVKYKPSETVDDQWLGVTVASAGPNKQVVACAHRYTKDNAATGMCHVLEPDLEYSTNLIFMSCRKLPHQNFMKDFGLCQQGMSAIVGKNDALLMGAPGSVFWQGTVFSVNITDEPGASTDERVSPYHQTPTEGEQTSPAPPYSYNGYAVAMGYFGMKGKLYYVSGAPKSNNNKGSVVFYTATSGKALKYEDKHIIPGTLEFSGYGSSLLAVDLNKDGYDDLLVGAPFYYTRYHGGAVYVYLGGPNMITSSSPVTMLLSRDMGEEECKKLDCEHARFGLSLTALGDINKDGYQDFAVGAPFEGNGVVYIYHGSNDKEGFNTKYVQRITSKDLPLSDLTSFGYSLSGGMDLDENGYPDLLVGAYESDSVALLRTRPIIKLIPSISISPEAVDLEFDKCSLDHVPLELRDRPCVEIKLCLSYSSSIPVSPEVTYTLIAEPQRRFPRVELLNAVDENKRELSGKVPLDATKESCVTETAIVKSHSKVEDKLNPMSFQFNFGLTTDTTNPQAYPSSAVQDINTFPFLDTDGSDSSEMNSLTAQAEFVKECGDDNKCFSNLQFTAELANLTRLGDTYQLVISNENILSIEMSVVNEDEPAYLTKVYIQAPENLAYLGMDPQDDVSCGRSPEDPTMIICDDIGNPLRADNLVTFTVKLNVPKDLADMPDMIHNITVLVNTSSTETTPLNDKHELKFRVINKAEVTLSTNVDPDNSILCKGEPRGASAMKDESDIGAAVTHNFIIDNQGPGVVSESYISIKWPYEVADKDGAGKYLLYLMRMPKIEGKVLKCNDDDIRQYVNPLKIKEIITPEEISADAEQPTYRVIDGESVPVIAQVPEEEENAPSRQRREAQTQALRSGARVVAMSCQDGSAKCFEYRCMLDKLETKKFVKISMEARLWESTLLSDYRKTASVQIISWGQYIIPDKLKIVQDKSDDTRRAITRAIPDILETSGGKIQWWIILVAVLVGLFVLLVLIFILYKVGFFRRKRMEDMQMYKAEKKEQAMLDNYDNNGV